MFSIVAHGLIVGAILTIPVLYVTDPLPKVNQMVAFIVAPPPAPAPPPPPPPPAPEARAPEPRPDPEPVDAPSVTAAPLEAPSGVLPEPATPPGVRGGVEGGVVGGVTGGIVGGLISAAPPPPPPPAPPPAPTEPVRVGGQITTPELVKRVEPAYPPVAAAAKLTGTVILEVVVDEQGLVTDVTVLRSQGILDRAAIAAVREWRYSPLVLNGIPTPFVATVTVSFSLKRPG